jgi:hypothetical protein
MIYIVPSNRNNVKCNMEGINMTTKTTKRATSYKSISLPSPGSKHTRVRIPIFEESSLRTTERYDALTGKVWTFATISEWWVNPDPNPPLGDTTARLTYSLHLREGRPSQHVTEVMVEGRADGWFPATTEQVAARSRWMRELRREELKLLNLAKQRGVQLLRCDLCGELSDLQASGWRLRLGESSLQPLCPRCAPG